MSDWLDTERPVSVSSKREAAEAFEQIRSAVKGLKEADNLTSDKIDKIADRVTDIQRQLAESETRDVGSIGGSDKELRKYVRDDGSVRLLSKTERREWGGKVVEVEAPGLLDDNVRTEAQNELQKAISDRNFLRLMLKPGSATPEADKRVFRAAQALGDSRITDAVGRAMYDTSGSGGEYVDDGFMPDVFRSYETPNGVAAAFPLVQVAYETWKRPKVAAGARPYIKGQLVSDNPAAYRASTPTSAESTMTIAGLAARTLVGDELVEDSAIPIMAFVQDELRRAIEDGREDAIINGDTAGTHQDSIASWNIRSRWGASGLGGADDHRKVWLGLRARAFDAYAADNSVGKTDQSSAKTAAGFLAAMAKLGERGSSMGLVCFVSPEYLVESMMDFDEVQTIDKIGSRASIISGQIASLFNVPVITTRFLSNDLATSGLYTGSGATTGFLLVDRSAFALYRKRGLVLEMDKEIKSGHYELVATARELFDSPEAATTANVHFSYNL